MLCALRHPSPLPEVVGGAQSAGSSQKVGGSWVVPSLCWHRLWACWSSLTVSRLIIKQCQEWTVCMCVHCSVIASGVGTIVSSDTFM